MSDYAIYCQLKQLNEERYPKVRKRPLMPYIELEDGEMETFWKYWSLLKEAGVDATAIHLQEALNGHSWCMESAILAFLEYWQNYPERLQDSIYHSTNCLAKALRDNWKPSLGFKIEVGDYYEEDSDY